MSTPGAAASPHGGGLFSVADMLCGMSEQAYSATEKRRPGSGVFDTLPGHAAAPGGIVSLFTG